MIVKPVYQIEKNSLMMKMTLSSILSLITL